MTAIAVDNEPCWLNCGIFYFLAFIFCALPLRVWLRRKSKEHNLEIKKHYYLDPTGPNVGNMAGTNGFYKIIDQAAQNSIWKDDGIGQPIPMGEVPGNPHNSSAQNLKSILKKVLCDCEKVLSF